MIIYILFLLIIGLGFILINKKTSPVKTSPVIKSLVITSPVITSPVIQILKNNDFMTNLSTLTLPSNTVPFWVLNNAQLVYYNTNKLGIKLSYNDSSITQGSIDINSPMYLGTYKAGCKYRIKCDIISTNTNTNLIYSGRVSLFIQRTATQTTTVGGFSFTSSGVGFYRDTPILDPILHKTVIGNHIMVKIYQSPIISTASSTSNSSLNAEFIVANVSLIETNVGIPTQTTTTSG